MTRPCLAVFDLDGTLLDTIGDLAASCNEMLAQRNLPQHSLDEYRKMVGNGIMRLVERALPEELRTAEYVAEARRDFVAYYIDHIDLYTHPYEGIVQVIEELQRRGWRLAVASNKFDEGTKKLIGKFFAPHTFEVVYGNREGVPLKPDATLLRTIAEECHTPIEQCWMVGDSGIDIITARNAGARSIGVTWGFRSREELEAEGADHIATRPSDILTLLEA